MAPLPALYVSHGSPMTALAPGRVGTRLAELARDLPRPRAIVVASAHWLAARPRVGGAARPETVHDFGGFPEALYALRYPAPGAPALAQEIAMRLTAEGLRADVDPQRGLDHGVWVPLRLLRPEADLPVVPLSIQPALGPAHAFALGRALASLRAQGVLVVGSGSITHNLQDWRGGDDGLQAPYVRPFTDWIEARLRADDLPALLDYRRQAPFAARAHPADEHLLPLFVAMGAAGGAQLGAHRIEAGIDMGFLAMDLYRFDGAGAA
ncbi:class III extradiol ring-cleavage dioxygenase [Luteimonas sp. FCS-9]|uniref:DODA-type extradiol aromatic ring-opening family dioxygenase n=1 Tax=Luteimonas sp. FCS-9 TaxID=1547516 RepID=UPI00063EAB25|nr:class III extradiol ring-cleavage dioxygenase [Luteimonas sp. FCS-9]KLI98727.1 extradiol ring-cleavage dioxygenase [Luteimonas sp. FCS-9]